MKTNFFQQIAGLGFKGNFLLNINQDETGVQTVSVVLKRDKAVMFGVFPLEPVVK